NKLLRNYTQNIDSLEYKLKINNIITCHGNFLTSTCINCLFKIESKYIENHINNKKLPYCPYCNPNKSDLLNIINNNNNNSIQWRKEEIINGLFTIIYNIPKFLSNDLFINIPTLNNYNKDSFNYKLLNNYYNNFYFDNKFNVLYIESVNF